MKTKNRYNSQRVIANRLRAEVERETPDVKGRVMASVFNREILREPEERKVRRPMLKYAVSFALVAAVLGGAFSIPRIFPAARQPETQSAAGVTASSRNTTMAQENPFVLQAYAAEVSASSQSTKGFGMSISRPITIYGDKIKNAVFEQQGLSIYDGYNVLKATGGELLCAQYVGFNIKCVGNHIKSISYAIDRGGFAQIKPLTRKEYWSIWEKIPYWAAHNNKTQDNPDYGDGKSMEVENGDGFDAGHGYFPVGDSYTISYADQDNYAVQYACRVTKSVSRKEYEDANADLRKIPHEMKEAMDGAVVTVTAHYDDGSTSSKKCVLKLDRNYWAFRAVEIG